MTGNGDGIAVIKPAVGHDVAGALNAVKLALLFEGIEQNGIGSVWPSILTPSLALSSSAPPA